MWGLLKRLVKKYRTSADYILGIIDDPAPAASQHRWHPDPPPPPPNSSGRHRRPPRAEMLAVLTVMAIAAKAEEDQVNPLLAKLDEQTRELLERSIQIESDLTVADVQACSRRCKTRRRVDWHTSDCWPAPAVGNIGSMGCFHKINDSFDGLTRAQSIAVFFA